MDAIIGAIIDTMLGVLLWLDAALLLLAAQERNKTGASALLIGGGVSALAGLLWSIRP